MSIIFSVTALKFFRWRQCHFLLDTENMLLPVPMTADPHHLDAYPDPSFHFGADPDPNFQFDVDLDLAPHRSDANLHPLARRPSKAPLLASSLLLWASVAPGWGSEAPLRAFTAPGFHYFADPELCLDFHADPDQGFSLLCGSKYGFLKWSRSATVPATVTDPCYCGLGDNKL